MKEVVVTGKTIEEAVTEGLKQLGIKENNAKIEVIEYPSGGFLGLIGKKEAKVKITSLFNIEDEAKKYIKNILSHMKLLGNVEASYDKDTLKLNILDVNDEDLGIIIGKRGNTLDSLQYLVSLHLNNNSDKFIRVQLDAEGYRSKREEALVKLAKKMAEKSVKTKRTIKLEPMNSFERKIIHSALQGFAGISTHSEGRDPYRKVVIISK